MNFNEAIRRPFKDLKILIIGIIIMMIPIVNILGFGYVMRASKLSIRRNYKMPEWREWTDLFVKGITAVIIALIYLIPTFLVVMISLGSSFLATGLTQSWIGILTLTSSLGIAMLISMVVLLVTLYVLPIALITYIDRESFSEAFKLNSIINKAFQAEYFTVWLVGIVYQIVLTAILSFIPVIGFGIATFITTITFFTLISEVYPRL